MERLAPKNVLRGQYLRQLNPSTIEIPGYTGENERRCYLADKAFQTTISVPSNRKNCHNPTTIKHAPAIRDNR